MIRQNVMGKKSIGLWLLCAGLAGAMASNAVFSQQARKGVRPERATVPPEFREPYQAALQGQSFELNEKNMLFMSGIGTVLMDQCDLPRNPQNRVTMALFVKSGQDLAALGNQYSNPNLGQMLGSLASGQGIFIAGAQVARGIGCSAPEAKLLANGIVKAVESNTRGPDGGESTFVRTCTPKYSEVQCQCLGNLGRAALPNIHQMTFHRDIIKAIIHRSPFVSLQISMVCGIVNY